MAGQASLEIRFRAGMNGKTGVNVQSFGRDSFMRSLVV
jgi:hypothetical protein